MKIQRTLPPTAAPVNFLNLLHGIEGAVLGEKHLKRFTGELKDYFGVDHVFPVSSGKAALFIVLKALQSLSPDKKKVLIPAYTCFSVPSAIVKAGLEVTLCDIDRETFDFDWQQLAKSVDEDTLCIVPGHMFGIPSDINHVNLIAKKAGAFVVEDAAQAMGEKVTDNMLGTLGDVGFFSLGRGKNVTCGAGGIIVTNDKKIAYAVEAQYSTLSYPEMGESMVEFLQLLVLSVFIHPLLYWLPSGLPFLSLGKTFFHKDFPVQKLSGMKAGILSGWSNLLAKNNNARMRNATHFINNFGAQGESEITHKTVCLRMPVLMHDKAARDKVYSTAQELGLGVSMMYPTPVNEVPDISDQFTGRHFPEAKVVADTLLCIPTHIFVNDNDRKKICDLFGEQKIAPHIPASLTN